MKVGREVEEEQVGVCGGQIHRTYLHTTLKVLFIDPWKGEPVVGRGLGRGRGNLRLVEVWEVGMGSFGVTSVL